MVNDNIKVGSFVRNKRSGNIGQVVKDARTIDAPFIKVMVVKPPLTKYCSYWMRKNVELIKDVHE